MRTLTLLSTSALLTLSALTIVGCSGSTDSTDAAATDTATSSEAIVYKIGVIAKSNSNPVFLAAKNGAFAAGKRLSEELDGATVEILWQTPAMEDAQLQAQYVEQLVASGIDGIAISCTDANLLTSALKAAVDKGVIVVTFDSDAPDSGRMAYYGVNDYEAGKELMRQLATVMNNEGVSDDIAISRHH
ncbi:hypothetical protein COB72_01275, partial [bacterium]